MHRHITHISNSSLFTGDCPAVDFETKMYQESMDILEHHIKPLRAVPGVVLEQSYLTKMSEGIRPLSQLANQLKLRGGLRHCTGFSHLKYAFKGLRGVLFKNL